MSLAREFSRERRIDPQLVSGINFAGIGIGNGYISSTDQSVYADYFRSLGYMTDDEYKKIKALDEQVLKNYAEGNYGGVLLNSQASLHMFASQIMNLTNIYDFTFNDNYLTNHEFICYLQQDHVRKGIHAGGLAFSKGYESYAYLNTSVIISKKPWLNDILEEGEIEVLIYNGNLDVIVHVLGMSNVVKTLQWRERSAFQKSERDTFWVWNDETERGEMAGYFNEGGGLTFMVVRNAGHMVPISQPRWARQLVYEFTHKKAKSRGGDRFARPEEMTKKKFSAFTECKV